MSDRPRIALDTNVLISGILFEGGNEAEIFNRVQNGEVDLYISPEIYDEFVEVLSRPKFQLTKDEITAACGRILALAKFVVPRERVRSKVRDIDDLNVLECARQVRATHIITGDNDLLTLKNYGRIAISSPSKFARKSDAFSGPSR